MKQNVARIALGLAITVFFIGHAAEWYPTADGKLDLLTRLDHIIYDMRLRLTMPRGVDERFVILDIDEKSLAEIGRWPWSRKLMAELAELTILFSDVRGFSGVSESLKPDELREYIYAYLTEMSMIIRSRYRGTLDKYIGDAIMAFWGAPVEDAEHARNGVLAARGWPALEIGVGVNSGTVRVGDMGSRIRRAYTAMGDAVNVASRLEGRTKIYGVGILVGEATRSRVKDVVFREIDRVKVKGKDEAITIYEPLGLEGDNEELQLWEQALRAYRARQWHEAEVKLLELQRIAPGCGLYSIYLKKIDALRREAPPDWDGVTVFDEK